MDITRIVAKMRFYYHANLLDVNNVLNQLGLRNDDKAEKVAKYHAMTAITDCLPRLGYDITKIKNEEGS